MVYSSLLTAVYFIALTSISSTRAEQFDESVTIEEGDHLYASRLDKMRTVIGWIEDHNATLQFKIDGISDSSLIHHDHHVVVLDVIKNSEQQPMIGWSHYDGRYWGMFIAQVNRYHLDMAVVFVPHLGPLRAKEWLMVKENLETVERRMWSAKRFTVYRMKQADDASAGSSQPPRWGWHRAPSHSGDGESMDNAVAAPQAHSGLRIW